MQRDALWIVGVIAAILIGVPVVVVGLYSYNVHRFQRRLDAIPLAPANYQPAAIDLVKIVQSDPSIGKTLSLQMPPPSMPLSIFRLNPEFIVVQPEETKVVWGGGFYHCGWTLKPATTGVAGSWDLWFWNENGTKKLLETITVPSEAHFDPADFGLPPATQSATGSGP